MTTPRDEATALLAEALEATTDLDPTTPVKGGYPDAGSVYLNWNDVLGAASSILAASPTLAAAIEFKVAWDRVERALPEGARMVVRVDGPAWGGAVTTADQLDATAALTRLAETLEAMR